MYEEKNTAKKSQFNGKETNRKKKPKYRGSNRRSRDNDYDRTPKDSITNDPAWYGNNQLVASAANIYFTKPFGTTMQLWNDAEWNAMTDGQVVQQSTAAPGIMVINTAPAFGPVYGNTEVSPINITMQAMYSYVRHANSGSRNYDGVDQMKYVLAMADVFSLINWMIRLYASINRYYPENRYFARHLVTAMGANFDSFYGNMAQFNYLINTVIAKSSAFAVPANMPFFSRRANLYANIYLEGEDIKDQVYMFNPKGFYKYTMDNTYDEAYLKFYPFEGEGGALITLPILTNYVDDMLRRLLESEDIGLISGDIIKAYGTNIIKNTMVPTNMLINPVVHDYNILYQIRNATIIGAWQYPDLHEDSTKTYLDFDYTIPVNSYTTALANVHKCILTSQSSVPTAGEVMESTRLMAVSSTYDYDGTTATVDLVCGTEVVVDINTYRIRIAANSGLPILDKSTVSSNLITLSASQACIYGCFKYHPAIYELTLNSSAFVTSFNGIFQDLDNCALIDSEELRNLHQAAIMNMLAVPQIALLQ